VAGALDMLLIQAALGTGRRFFPARPALRLGRALAGRPGMVAARAGSLAGELARIAGGASAVAPAAKDRRFADPAWTGNPVLRRVVQAYLATGDAALGLLDAAPLDWRDAQRLRFALTALVDALSPSNSALLSPEAWKAAIDSGGGSLIAGTRHLLGDLASPPRVPSMVPPGAYTVGTDLAVTPGDVVLRTPLFELIQYRPSTGTVRRRPLLIVPPTINKYYILDLAPGRSMVEYLVGQGQQVFVMSWRNPDARHAAWGFDAYVRAIADAVDAVAEICGADAVHLLGGCSGGILASLAAAAPSGGRPLASLTLLVTMLDQSRNDAVGTLVDESMADAAIAASARQGYLDGRRLAEIFAWLRPRDLIWHYWVNNYLLGREPARFDILFWNADTTRMTARLHRDFVRAAAANALASPGALTVVGHEVDLGQVDLDSYVVAGVADHICPWQSC
jgi:polyhydroxyalkanoate synthase